MSKVKLDLVIQGRLPSCLTPCKIRTVLKKTMEALKASSAVMGLAFVDESKMADLNKAYHGERKPTDVLSFAYQPAVDKSGELEGDIAICTAYAKKQAESAGVALDQELKRLLIHGLMHIAGFDHRTRQSEKTMFGLQEDILKNL